MAARLDTDRSAPRIVAAALPFIIVAIAGVAVRTPVATTHPTAALLLYLWIVADTLMLALIARSSGRPARHAILAALAGACAIVVAGLPASLRDVLIRNPWLSAAMAICASSHVAWASVRARRAFGGSHPDARARWVAATSALLPPTLVRLAVAELSVIHMALFRWGGPADVPVDARAFSYHRHLTPICVTLLILSAIEIAVYHLLVAHWSRTASLAMFVLSDLGVVYLVGFIKSLRFRPILLTVDGVSVRTGFLIEQFVPLDAIAAVETSFAGADIRDPATMNAALLAWPNILLRLDRPVGRRSLFKERREFDRVAFRLDDPEPFVRLLRWRLSSRIDSPR